MSTSVSSWQVALRPVAVELLLGLPFAVGGAVAVASALALPTGFVVQVTALYAAASGMILGGLSSTGPERRGLGAANRVTLARVVLILPVVGLLFNSGAWGPAGRWWVVALAGLALALDGLDGWVARRTDSCTPFGARFDMESDAVLILALSALVWQSGQAPAWVLLVGAMRYLFVAAGWFVPALRGELPASMRRKVVCVVQGVALVAALAPPFPPVAATAVTGLALVLLTWSFGVDTAWLLRFGAPPRPGSG